jgi:glycosyltransferase involved in cell wall biosynthesis
MQVRGHQVMVLCVQDDNAAHAEVRYADRMQDGLRVRALAFNGGANPDPFRWSYEHPEIEQVVGTTIEQFRPQVMHLFSGYLLGASVLQAAYDRHVRTVVDLTDYWWHCHQINLLTPLGERCAGPTPTQCARCYAERQRRFRVPAQLAPEVARRAWDAVSPDSLLGQHLGIAAQVARAERLQTVLAQADQLIAPSQVLAQFYREQGADPVRIRVLRQGVELDQCRLRTPDPALRVGYLGQVKPHKGVDLLLAAWSQLQGERERRLTIYGSAEGYPAYQQQIAQQVAQLPAAHWAGAYRGAEVWDVLAALDVVVVPSRWIENSPNSILEAQAVGVPIVGAALGGIAELVRHEHNGLLFASDDARDLAQQLQRLLDEPGLLAQLRANLMPFTAHETVMDQLAQIYGNLVRPVRVPQRTPLYRTSRCHLAVSDI